MVTIIGDVHGKYKKYCEIIKNYSHTIQLGDFGFNYDILKDVDPKNHVFIGGNHDNYDKLNNVPHYLGDYAKGGSTQVVIDSPDGKHYQGLAICSKKENYNKKMGVRIALGRSGVVIK